YTLVTAVPGIEDSRMRRSGLPSVTPKPRGSGSTVNSPYASPDFDLNSGVICTGTSSVATFERFRRSARVVLDDLQLVDGNHDVLASRTVEELALQRLRIELEPRVQLAAPAVFDVGVDHGVLLGRLRDLDDVAGAQAVRRHVHALAVHQDVAVRHELP